MIDYDPIIIRCDNCTLIRRIERPEQLTDCPNCGSNSYELLLV